MQPPQWDLVDFSQKRQEKAEPGGCGRELAEHRLLGKQIRNVISCAHAVFPCEETLRELGFFWPGEERDSRGAGSSLAGTEKRPRNTKAGTDSDAQGRRRGGSPEVEEERF